jgi:hypothetical protein
MITPNEIKPAAPAEGLDDGRCAVDAGFGETRPGDYVRMCSKAFPGRGAKVSDHRYRVIEVTENGIKAVRVGMRRPVYRRSWVRDTLYIPPNTGDDPRAQRE